MARKKETDPIRQVLAEFKISQNKLSYGNWPARIYGSYSYIAGWFDEEGHRARWWLDGHSSTESALRFGLREAHVVVTWRHDETKDWPWEMEQVLVRTHFHKSRTEIADWLRKNLL